MSPAHGPTLMHPGTHTDRFHDAIHHHGPLVLRDARGVRMDLRTGDAVLMDSRLYHCGGANTMPVGPDSVPSAASGRESASRASAWSQHEVVRPADATRRCLLVVRAVHVPCARPCPRPAHIHMHARNHVRIRAIGELWGRRRAPVRFDVLATASSPAVAHA